MSNLYGDAAGEVTQHLRGLEARGSHGLVAQLIDSLMGESSGQMEAVRNAAATGDREALYRAAHSLQGSVAIVGADSVARACADLVKTARSGSFEHVTRIVAQLQSDIEAIRKALVGWKETETISAGAPAEIQRAASAQDVGRRRVLVIDDDAGIRKITQMLVEALGPDVETARDVPVIMVTTLETKEHRLHAVEAGANDFIAKPVDETELRVRSTSLLKLKAAQDEVKRYQTHLETVERLAILAEYKDKVTGRHIQRMSEYSAVIARGLKLPADEVELILHASRMHDVGKIAVPEAILRKPAALDPQEWTVMRQHSAIGSRMLENSSSEILQAGKIIALHHHERWDGAGYPSGLAGSDIPLWGRICAVADVFDAVTSERPYKPAFPNEEALQLLLDGKGKHFDPRVIDVFFECLQEILAIQNKYKDEHNS